jgi:hypothetical protein
VHVCALGAGQSALVAHGFVHSCFVCWANGSHWFDAQSPFTVHA